MSKRDWKNRIVGWDEVSADQLLANPRIEQNIILNDEAVYRFHRDWLEEVIVSGREEPED